jgi:hypothetical protein
VNDDNGRFELNVDLKNKWATILVVDPLTLDVENGHGHNDRSTVKRGLMNLRPLKKSECARL